MFTKMKKKRRTFSDGAKNHRLQISNNNSYPASGSKQYKNKNKNKQTISITQMALKNGMDLKINTKGVCT